ncbi:uncharacterized protein MONOS_9143 [Monocercomonoides exilis]|uniref:uncharacterized protein n=1 Tax=Monocercomonoides exilis TaxID=2049356 RepID=UPI00355A31A3|nr:hypothetical protein MONOS_9143 [Monocercomonoides exilis]|eukprot:MONOS_9143.1-p1 / transcript=MONOS_9143.1 / gene=MONOS_9143 / organism=Monocercomonoides_exilis_PA203 / gene_product=unspecified product / transcript_product=unspecified product / location=Mono_scaffold00368:23012-24196(+) / protein_length=307 / sequence_SO=supercontig / SO=protein_coding / is_pseudo=false
MEIGEEWWKRGLKRFNVPDLIIFESRNSVASTTWSSNTFGFAHFSLALEEEGYGDFPKEFSDWSQIYANFIIKLRDKACRFREMERISMNQSVIQEDSIHLFTNLKTSPTLSYITVPILKSADEKVCPGRAIKSLWGRVMTTYENRDTFLLNTGQHTPLKTEGIRKLARLGMTQIGIPGEYRSYTLKHAAISALLSKGVPEAMVARHARMSPNSHTPTRSYFKANLASRMADTLLSTDDNRKPQSQMCLQDRNNFAQPAQTASSNFPKAFERETIFPNKVEEPGEENRDKKEILLWKKIKKEQLQF